jgi:F0F1-type ATP synthase assembly protein I
MSHIITAVVFTVIGFVSGVIVGRKNAARVDKIAEAAGAVKSDLQKIP